MEGLIEKLRTQCWGLISLIEEFITKEEFEFLKYKVIKLPDQSIDELKGYEYPIDFLIEHYPEESESYIRQHIILSTIMDFCYFIQESLTAAGRRRTVVAFSLLRRPLVYDLIIFLRLLTDTDFYPRFCKDENYDPAKYSEDEIKEMLADIERISIIGKIPSNEIYRVILDKDNPSSFINLSNRAIHPTTTRKWNKTGAMNFNFIFSLQEDVDAQLEIYYRQLNLSLLYCFRIMLTSIIQYAPEDKAAETYYSQLIKALAITGDEKVLTSLNDMCNE